MDENQSTEQQPVQQQANLSLQDLLLVTQIIQVSSQRGAFRADELSNVGGLYDRIIAFLKASGALVENTQPAQTDNESTGEQNA